MEEPLTAVLPWLGLISVTYWWLILDDDWLFRSACIHHKLITSSFNKNRQGRLQSSWLKHCSKEELLAVSHCLVCFCFCWNHKLNCGGYRNSQSSNINHSRPHWWAPIRTKQLGCLWLSHLCWMISRKEGITVCQLNRASCYQLRHQYWCSCWVWLYIQWLPFNANLCSKQPCQFWIL